MTEATLELGEPHPMAHGAMDYVRENINAMHREAIASTALSGNRNAEICYSTLQRLDNGEPVSDRYIFGLAWLIKELNEETP